MPLYRSQRNKILGGVCGGIAEWLGWSPAWVRFLYVVVSILSAAFPGTIVPERGPEHTSGNGGCAAKERGGSTPRPPHRA